MLTPSHFEEAFNGKEDNFKFCITTMLPLVPFSLRVKQMIVVVNKMDELEWCEEKYEEIKERF